MLNIYLLWSYRKNDSVNYPIIYLLDGSMNEDFIHMTGIVSFQSYLGINTIPESIVVGISRVDRKRDCTYPTSILNDQEDFPTSGGSAKFIVLLEQEVKPMIAENFRVNENSTLIGQSLVGLLAADVLLKNSALFNHYLIFRPSLWWGSESLIDHSFIVASQSKIHFAVGNEGKLMVGDTNRLVKMFRKSNGTKSEKITFEYL